MEQCRAARAMLAWSQTTLAESANVSRQTIADFERGAHMPIANNLASITAAFQEAGITLIHAEDGAMGVLFQKAR